MEPLFTKVTANAHPIKVNRLIETENSTEVKSDQLFHILNFIYNELFHIYFTEDTTGSSVSVYRFQWLVLPSHHLKTLTT